VFSLHEDAHDHGDMGQQSSVATLFAQLSQSERVRMVLARTLHAVPRVRLRSSQQVHLPLLQHGTTPLKSSQ